MSPRRTRQEAEFQARAEKAEFESRDLRAEVERLQADVADLVDRLRVVVEETEHRTFGKPGYDITYDHLHDTAVEGIHAARAASPTPTEIET